MNNKKFIMGPLEQKVMECIWNKESVTCREVQNCINSEATKETAYTTLMTVMDRLYNKGFLSRKKEGKTYVYTFKRTKSETIKLFVDNMVSSLVSRFGEDAVVAFAKEIEEYSTKNDKARK